ncbi:MAG: hypothetical protein HUJ51_01910 [Eggerthellaceae bacterium]|nr:hypothetical protein [Eggerthellaceae bacterium]
MQYKLQIILYIDKFRVEIAGRYEPTDSFGAKSIGKNSTKMPAPAITDAIFCATGVWHRKLPTTLEQIDMVIYENSTIDPVYAIEKKLKRIKLEAIGKTYKRKLQI